MRLPPITHPSTTITQNQQPSPTFLTPQFTQLPTRPIYIQKRKQQLTVVTQEKQHPSYQQSHQSQISKQEQQPQKLPSSIPQPQQQQPQQRNNFFVQYLHKNNCKVYLLRAALLLSFIGNIVITYYVMFKKNQPFSKVYFIYITPDPIFFKIWPIIYTTLFLSLIHNLWKNIWRTKSSLIYIVSNILLMGSSAIWQTRNVTSIALSGFVLASVDNATIYFWRVLMDEHEEGHTQQQSQNGVQLGNVTQVSIQNIGEGNGGIPLQNQQASKPVYPRYSGMGILIVRNVYSLYIGWVSVTGTVIVGLCTVYWWGFSLCEQLVIYWISSPIFAIGIYLFMACKKEGEYKYCMGYVMGVIWGFVGAGMASVENINERGEC